jgi:hypothetical protein
MGALKALLSNPGQEWEALGLLRIEDTEPERGAFPGLDRLDGSPEDEDGDQAGPAVIDDRTAGRAPILDENSIQVIQQELARLTDSQRGTVGREFDKIEEKKQKLEERLKKDTNVWGQSRLWDTRADKDVNLLNKRLSRRIEDIRRYLPALAEHLERSVRSGAHLLYHPTEATTWTVE